MRRLKPKLALAAVPLLALGALFTGTASASVPSPVPRVTGAPLNAVTPGGQAAWDAFNGVDPTTKAAQGKFHPATGPNGGYELTLAWQHDPTALAGVTSGSADLSVAQQGLQESADHGWLINHSLDDFVLAGTCSPTAVPACTQDPGIEITMSSGQTYCKASFKPCFREYSWINGVWQSASDGYIPITEPNDGSWHPGQATGKINLGYLLDDHDQKLFITGNGTNLGYIPYSYFGQSTFGPVTKEMMQDEVYSDQGVFGTAPEPTMNYTISNFTDTNANTLNSFTETTGADYSTTGLDAAATGWTVSGGRGPATTTTSWPIEMSQDNSRCLDNSSGTTANGNPIVLADCGTWTAHQAWRYDPTTQEIWYQDGGSSGWCLDNPSNGTSNGTQLVLQACSGLTGEKWTPSIVGNDYILWTGGNGSVCINNPNGTTVGGAVTRQACSSSSATQQTDTYNY